MPLESDEIPIAAVMQHLAAEAIKMAKQEHGFVLDYSEASLRLVDRMLVARMGDEVIDPSTLSEDESQEMWMWCKIVGGYVGEVIIRNLGGRWFSKTLESGQTTVRLMAFERFDGSPPERIWRALTEPYCGVASYYRGLIAIASTKPSVVEGSGPRELQVRELSTVPPLSTSRRKPWWKWLLGR